MQSAGAEGDGAGAWSGAEGGRKGVEAAVAGDDDAHTAHDAELLGGGIGFLTGALGEDVDGEGFAFGEFLKEQPARRGAEQDGEVFEGKQRGRGGCGGWGGGFGWGHGAVSGWDGVVVADFAAIVFL